MQLPDSSDEDQARRGNCVAASARRPSKRAPKAQPRRPSSSTAIPAPSTTGRAWSRRPASTAGRSRSTCPASATPTSRGPSRTRSRATRPTWTAPSAARRRAGAPDRPRLRRALGTAMGGRPPRRLRQHDPGQHRDPLRLQVACVRQGLADPRARRALLRGHDPLRACASALKRGQPEPLPDEAFELFYKASKDKGTQRAVLRLYRASPPSFLEPLGPPLRELNRPTLVVWGAHDPYIKVEVRRAAEGDVPRTPRSSSSRKAATGRCGTRRRRSRRRSSPSSPGSSAPPPRGAARTRARRPARRRRLRSRRRVGRRRRRSR